MAVIELTRQAGEDAPKAAAPAPVETPATPEAPQE
jgi:hypothetical protein